MNLKCYYCSKEIIISVTKEEEEVIIKDSIWFCSAYCKESYVNIQVQRKKEGEKEELQ